MADLRDATVVDLPRDHPIVDAQVWVTRVLDLWIADPTSTVDLAGVRVRLPDGLTAVSSLIRQILAGGNLAPSKWVAHTARSVPRRVTADLGDRANVPVPTGPGSITAVTADAAHFGVLVAIALDVLRTSSLEDASRNLERLADVGGVRGLPPTVRRASAHRRQDRRKSPLVETVWLKARQGAMTPTERLAFRVDGPVPRHPSAPFDQPATHLASGTEIGGQGTTAIAARLVPQTIWPSVAASLPRQTTKDTAAFGVTAAIALARMGTFHRWRVVAVRLGIPASMIAGVRAQFRTLVQHSVLGRYAMVLDQVLTTLIEAPPPIDYARRRAAFAGLVEDDLRGFGAACDRARLTDTARRRRFASYHLWEMVTGGDVRLRPRGLRPFDPADRTAYAKFLSGPGADLRRYLICEAERMCSAYGFAEPVQWQPILHEDGATWISEAGQYWPERGPTPKDPAVEMLNSDDVDLESIFRQSYLGTGNLPRSETLDWRTDAETLASVSDSAWIRRAQGTATATAQLDRVHSELGRSWGPAPWKWENLLDCTAVDAPQKAAPVSSRQIGA